MPASRADFIASERYKWIVVGLLWVAGFLNAVDRHSIYALFPVLEKELGMSRVQLGLLGSGFLWAYALLGPFAGYVGDRFPRRKVIYVSLFAWSTTTLLNSFVHSAAGLILLRVLLAVGEAFYIPAAMAMLSDHHSERTRSKAVGLFLSSMTSGLVAGGFLGGYMAEHFGWRTLFVVLGSAGILWVPVLAAALHAPAAQSGRAGEAKLHGSLSAAVAHLARIATVRSMALAFVCYSVAGAVISAWSPYFLFHHFRMSVTGAGFSAGFFVEIPTLVGNLAGGAAGDYFALRSFRGRMLTQAGSLLLSAPFFIAAGTAGKFAGFATSMALLGVIRGAWSSNVMPVLCQIVPENLRSTTFGVFNGLGNLAGGVAAIVAAHAVSGPSGIGVAIAFCSLTYWLAAGTLIFSAAFQLKKDFRGPLLPSGLAGANAASIRREVSA